MRGPLMEPGAGSSLPRRPPLPCSAAGPCVMHGTGGEPSPAPHPYQSGVWPGQPMPNWECHRAAHPLRVSCCNAAWERASPSSWGTRAKQPPSVLGNTRKAVPGRAQGNTAAGVSHQAGVQSPSIRTMARRPMAPGWGWTRGQQLSGKLLGRGCKTPENPRRWGRDHERAGSQSCLHRWLTSNVCSAIYRPLTGHLILQPP